jgi:hypothetical protein
VRVTKWAGDGASRAGRLVGKELRQVQHKAGYDTVIVFEDGAITAWSEVKINILWR